LFSLEYSSMKVELWVIGKTSFSFVKEGSAMYQKRLKKYLPFKIEVIPDIKNAKNMPAVLLKKKEAEAVLSKLKPNDALLLLDENGKSFSSKNFAQFLEKQLQQQHKRLIFLIGGAYGFDESIYQKAKAKVSLSTMTFSHQIIRLFFMEQFYRAMTILNNDPYHND